MQLSLSQSLSLPLVKEKNVAPDTVRNGKEDFIEDYHSRGESGLDSTSDSDRCTLVANGQGEWMKGTLPGGRDPDWPWKVGDS